MPTNTNSLGTIIYPHQLHRDHPGISGDRTIFLVEEYLLFRQYSFHKQKIMLHRATMRVFRDELVAQGYKVEYIETHELTSSNSVFDKIKEYGCVDIYIMDTVDDWLEKAIGEAHERDNFKLTRCPSHLFLTPPEEGMNFFQKRKGNRQFFMADFYIWQRRRMNILIDNHSNPLGGKWSFDTENRKKLPKNHILPDEFSPHTSPYISEAQEYVVKYFNNNPGEISFNYPIDPQGAKERFEDFLRSRLDKFGDYEDAILQEESTVYHSVLTSSLNIGLISPEYVIQRTLKYAHEAQTPLNSLEGFIRQIIGWREYIRIIYILHGRKMRGENFWGHTNKVDERWYKGTHSNKPLDITIRKLLKTAYSHHIERLMILGSAMLMNRIHPEEVYKWFMEMYIDSYDWVMVPNVYGMSQYADGGSIVTKPYLCGSNYILKMSDISRDTWCDIWDNWYWSYIADFRDIFVKNPRMSMMVKILDKRLGIPSPTQNS